MDDMVAFFERAKEVNDILNKVRKERRTKTTSENEECLFAIKEENPYSISFVKINEAVYESIFFNISPAPPERGGILGMKDGVISAFVLDNSEQEAESAEYSPNNQFLNRQIEKWADEGIEFCGILHSHPSGQTTLSGSDMEYIKKLYHINPWLEKTYFPLIIDGCDMIVYAVEKSDGQIEVKRTQPEIID